MIKRGFLYPGRESNPHVFKGHWILSPARLPIPPPRLEDGTKVVLFLQSANNYSIFFRGKVFFFQPSEEEEITFH